jgi:transposase-like protein
MFALITLLAMAPMPATFEKAYVERDQRIAELAPSEDSVRTSQLKMWWQQRKLANHDQTVAGVERTPLAQSKCRPPA